MDHNINHNIKQTPKVRFAYMDNVRSFIIFLVIAMHTAVTYSGDGGWFYIEGSPEKSTFPEMLFFGFFQSNLQAWFMGALFFISAYFAAKSLAKYGTINFLKERLFRLGLPLLIYVFIIAPFISYVILGYYSQNSFWVNWYYYVKGFWWLGSTGPLWFVQVLLFLCIIYTIIKKCISTNMKIMNIRPVHIVSTILITTIIAFLIRLVFPVGTSYYNLQFSYFASYIVMFIAGIIIGENDLLDNITIEKNIRWLLLMFIIGIPLWAATMIFGGALEGERYFDGGFYWQSFAYALWESFVAISCTIGIIALFKKRMNVKNNFTELVRDNAFGIYVFHAPILIEISLILKGWIISPVIKFIAVTIIAFFVCLLFSFLIRKIKPIGILLK